MYDDGHLSAGVAPAFRRRLHTARPGEAFWSTAHGSNVCGACYERGTVLHTTYTRSARARARVCVCVCVCAV
jgi:hypothetical protein